MQKRSLFAPLVVPIRSLFCIDPGPYLVPIGTKVIKVLLLATLHQCHLEPRGLPNSRMKRNKGCKISFDQSSSIID